MYFKTGAWKPDVHQSNFIKQVHQQNLQQNKFMKQVYLKKTIASIQVHPNKLINTGESKQENHHSKFIKAST